MIIQIIHLSLVVVEVVDLRTFLKHFKIKRRPRLHSTTGKSEAAHSVNLELQIPLLHHSTHYTNGTATLLAPIHKDMSMYSKSVVVPAAQPKLVFEEAYAPDRTKT